MVLDFETHGLEHYAVQDTLVMERLTREMAESPKQREDRLIMQAVRWATDATQAIQDAGGSVRLLADFPDTLVSTMVRNGISLKHNRG